MREILCFGDSNTYGLIPGTKERYKENIRWTGILQQKLKEKDCRRKDSAEEHIKILLVSPILLGEKVWEPEYDPEFDEQSVETSRQLKTVYSRIAKKHGIDFLAASDVAEPSSRDREHMDEESHRRFAEAVYERLAG